MWKAAVRVSGVAAELMGHESKKGEASHQGCCGVTTTTVWAVTWGLYVAVGAAGQVVMEGGGAAGWRCMVRAVGEVRLEGEGAVGWRGAVEVEGKVQVEEAGGGFRSICNRAVDGAGCRRMQVAGSEGAGGDVSCSVSKLS